MNNILLKPGNNGPFIDYRFDQGSLSSYTLIDTTPTIRIVPKKHWNNQWLWFAVRSRRWGGKIPHFLIAKANRFAAPFANENLAVWSTSPDTDTWTKFDNQTVGASDIEFYHNTAFPSGTIYVAYIPMYPFSRVQRKMTEWSAADARIVDTPSTTDLAISNLTARDNGDGRTAPALPLYGFNLTNANANTKNIAILTSRNHPSEASGSFQLEGALSWLLGGSVAAEFLLDWFDFYIYPCINPQGVWGGYFRSSPQTPASDNNRIWDTTGTNEAVDALKTAMNADTGGAIEVGIDFHSANEVASTGYIDSEDHTATLYAAFLAKMVGYDASFGFMDETVVTMLHYLWNHTYSAKLGLVLEAMCLTSMNTPVVWNTQGANAMKSLAAMLAEGRWTNGPSVGSRDFNGTTDRIDFANIADLKGQACTVSAWVNLDVNNANQYLLCCHDSGDSVYGLVFNCVSAGEINFIRHGTTDYIWFSPTVQKVTTGAWHHILATNDGGVLAGSTAFYIDGVADNPPTFTNGSGAETAHTGSWSLGGRIYNDTRNLNGKAAQVRVFNRVLNAGEIAKEAAGDVSTASGLIFWFKGNTNSLTASPGGDGTADGTSEVTGVGNGPTIYYP